MKRKQFLKRLFTGIAAIAVAPKLLAEEKNEFVKVDEYIGDPLANSDMWKIRKINEGSAIAKDKLFFSVTSKEGAEPKQVFLFGENKPDELNSIKITQSKHLKSEHPIRINSFKLIKSNGRFPDLCVKSNQGVWYYLPTRTFLLCTDEDTDVLIVQKSLNFNPNEDQFFFTIHAGQTITFEQID